MTTSARVLSVLVIGMVLAGCTVFGIPFGDDGPAGNVDTNPQAATVIVTTEQEGCCYVEGSLRFAKLDGPSSFDWDVDDGSIEDAGGPSHFLIGRQTHSVTPGDYTIIEWEEVCDGNCGYLDGPTNRCTLHFTAEEGATVRIRVLFPIPNPCVATIDS